MTDKAIENMRSFAKDMAKRYASRGKENFEIERLVEHDLLYYSSGYFATDKVTFIEVFMAIKRLAEEVSYR